MLLQHADIAHHHAPVDGLAHVVSMAFSGAKRLKNVLLSNAIWTGFGQDFGPILLEQYRAPFDFASVPVHVFLAIYPVT